MRTRQMNMGLLIAMNTIIMGWVVLSLWRPIETPVFDSFDNQTAMVIVTIAIAASSAVTALFQYKQHEHEKRVANVNHQFALYDKRLEAYKALDEFMLSFIRQGRVKFDDHNELTNRISYLRFLLPVEQEGFIQEFRSHGFEAALARHEWAALVEELNQTRTPAADKARRLDDALETMRKHERWFIEQWEEGRIYKEFEPLLRIPSEI